MLFEIQAKSSGVTRVPCVLGQKGILCLCFHYEFCTNHKNDGEFLVFHSKLVLIRSVGNESLEVESMMSSQFIHRLESSLDQSRKSITFFTREIKPFGVIPDELPFILLQDLNLSQANSNCRLAYCAYTKLSLSHIFS